MPEIMFALIECACKKNILQRQSLLSLFGAHSFLLLLHLFPSCSIGWDRTVSANHIRSWTRYCSSHSQWKYWLFIQNLLHISTSLFVFV